METILDSLETLERKLLYIQSVVKMSKSTLKTFDEQNEGTAFLMEGLKTIEMFLPYEELAELYEQLIINVLLHLCFQMENIFRKLVKVKGKYQLKL